MKSIATLGPTNTYSELAARLLAKQINEACEIKLFPSFGKAYGAIGTDCLYGLFPIENMTEGYVSKVLDLLVHTEFSITHELLLPIQFSLAANCSSFDDIKTLYAQFVAQSQ